jgi:oligosaccharide repeat unit polymerase
MVSLRSLTQTKIITRPPILQPAVIFAVVWGSVFLLYSLHLSGVLIYNNTQVLNTILTLCVPFLLACGAYSMIRGMILIVAPPVQSSDASISEEETYRRLDKRLTLFFRLWLVVTAFEIVVSGGLPLVWLFTGSSKTYFDFGIPSLHGLVNSLVMSIALCRVVLFLKTGERRHLLVPIFFVFWPFVIISRMLLVVTLLEYAVIYIALKGVKAETIIRSVVGALSFIFIFGFIGDLRSGAETFRQLAQPTNNYPDWLPSGVLWIYIYVTTPINNLVHTSLWVKPINSLLFPNTAVSLFPSVIRSFIYSGNAGQAVSGDLVTDTFNVSTAYVGPVQDFGNYGMAAFSVVIGMLCQMFYHQKTLRSLAIYAVLAQCLLTSLFFNNFFSLPIISQVFWIYAIFAIRSRPHSE